MDYHKNLCLEINDKLVDEYNKNKLLEAENENIINKYTITQREAYDTQVQFEDIKVS